MYVPGHGPWWSGPQLIDQLPRLSSDLSLHYGPSWWSQGSIWFSLLTMAPKLALTCTLISQISFRPASSPWILLKIWTFCWTWAWSLGLPCSPRWGAVGLCCGWKSPVPGLWVCSWLPAPHPSVSRWLSLHTGFMMFMFIIQILSWMKSYIRKNYFWHSWLVGMKPQSKPLSSKGNLYYTKRSGQFPYFSPNH